MNENENGKFFKKPIIILAIVIVIICALIGIILVININKSDKTKNGGSSATSDNVNSNSSSSLYDGTVELGTRVDFKINTVKIPKAVGSEESCIVNDNRWYYSLDADGNAINIYTYGSNFTEDVILPSTLNGHKVISIGKGVSDMENTLFHTSIGGEKYWNNIVSITVPEGVQYINGQAFSGYKNLKKVTLPDSIIFIGEDAFTGSKNLAYINSDVEGKVVMPKNLQYYGDSLFRYNTKINSFEFPEQIDYIQDWTFYETEGFNDVTISKQFKYVGYGAFSSSSVKNLTIEDGVQIIGKSAFNMNESLEKVNMANSVISIEQNAFSLCRSLKEFNYRGKLKYIGKDAFNRIGVKNVLQDNQLPQK